MKSSLCALALLFGLSGCYTTKYVYSNERAGNETEHVWQHGLFYGLVSLGDTDLSRVCGSAGVYKIKAQIGGIGLLGHWLTFGMWTPMHVKVICAAK